jgi:DNA replication protein DnaC
MTDQAAQAAIDQACRALRLPTIRTKVDEITTAAAREQLSYWGFLAELLLAECDDRDRRRCIRRIKAAGFPREKMVSRFRLQRQPRHQPGYH